MTAPGSVRRERFGAAADPVAGRLLAADPPRLLEYTWGAETLRWELRPDGDGCRLVFVNTIDDDGAWQRAADLQKQYEEHS